MLFLNIFLVCESSLFQFHKNNENIIEIILIKLWTVNLHFIDCLWCNKKTCNSDSGVHT